MNIKNLIQIIIILIISIILFLFFKNFFSNKDVSQIKKETLMEKTKIKIETKNLDNIIESFNYKAIDANGNLYEINSEIAEVSTQEPDILLLTNVKAIIHIEGKDPINIFSGFAKYNKINYDTNFYDDVTAYYENKKLISQNLDLLFKNDKAIMYNNVKLNSDNLIVRADTVDFDLLSGNISVSMYEQNKKINFKKWE